MSIHLVISEAEQNAICNALHFSLVMHNSIFNGGIDADALEQASLAFKEDGAANVDKLLEKVATLN